MQFWALKTFDSTKPLLWNVQGQIQIQIPIY